jgi:hypothetical protein
MRARLNSCRHWGACVRQWIGLWPVECDVRRWTASRSVVVEQLRCPGNGAGDEHGPQGGVTRSGPARGANDVAKFVGPEKPGHTAGPKLCQRA